MKNPVIKQRLRSRLMEFGISYRMLTDEFLKGEIKDIKEFDEQLEGLLENYALKIMNKMEVF